MSIKIDCFEAEINISSHRCRISSTMSIWLLYIKSKQWKVYSSSTFATSPYYILLLSTSSSNESI